MPTRSDLLPNLGGKAGGKSGASKALSLRRATFAVVSLRGRLPRGSTDRHPGSCQWRFTGAGLPPRLRSPDTALITGERSGVFWR